MTRQERYASVYGAYFAAQVHHRMVSGRGIDEEAYDRFHEEAEWVAKEACDAATRAVEAAIEEVG